MRTPPFIRRCALPIAVLCAVALAACVADAPPARALSSRDIFLNPDTIAVRGEIPRNTTLDTLLHAEGLAATAVNDTIAAARTVFDPRRLRSSQPFSLERTLEGALRHFEYEIDAESFLRVAASDREADGLRAEIVPIPRTLERVTAAGSIDEATPSLFQASRSIAAAVLPAVAAQVRAPGHVALLVAPHASRAAHRARAPRRGLRGSARRTRRRRVVRHRRVRDVRLDERAHGSAAPRERTIR